MWYNCLTEKNKTSKYEVQKEACRRGRKQNKMNCSCESVRITIPPSDRNFPLKSLYKQGTTEVLIPTTGILSIRSHKLDCLVLVFIIILTLQDTQQREVPLSISSRYTLYTALFFPFVLDYRISCWISELDDKLDHGKMIIWINMSNTVKNITY